MSRLGTFVFAVLWSLDGMAATLLHNVSGYTMNGGKRVEFHAIEYADGVVTQIFRDGESAAGSRASDRMDGGGASLLPGLIDAHGHVASLGRSLASVDLVGASSEFEAVARVRKGAKDTSGDWLLGYGWNQVLWPGANFPTRASIDAVVDDRPVLLRRVDGHAVWVNSEALRLAGVDAETPDPSGGRILRDADGSPTGVLIDNAMSLVTAVLPPPTLASKRSEIKRALEYLASVGMTGVHDAGASALELDAYQSLDRENAMPVRVYAMLKYAEAGAAARISDGPYGDPGSHFSARSVKISADGALGSRGAALLEDYSDDAGNRGLLLLGEAGLDEAIRKSAAAGFQVNVHAIGDHANRLALEGFERLGSDPAQRALRHRIEHAQIVAPADLPRFAEAGAIASVQPTHATSDKNMAGDRLGEDRLAGAYAWRQLLESGARLAGGSDFPVEPANPFFGLHAAVTRQDRSDEPPGGWRMEEHLTREEALSLFTEDAAYAGHAEDTLGRLLPGYAADFILVRDDFFAVPPEALWQNEVLMTVVGGEAVYRSSAAPGQP